MSPARFTLLSLATAALSAAAPSKKSKGQVEGPLHFNEDGTFHITVIQDTHMGDGMITLNQENEED